MVLRDLQNIGFDATSWYSAVQDCVGWYDACQALEVFLLLVVLLLSLDHLLVNVAECLRVDMT